MIHANSQAAYHDCATLFDDRKARVLATIREHGPMTDRQVMKALGFLEPNSVRPRITELIQEGELIEVGSVKDNATGKTVRLVQAAD